MCALSICIGRAHCEEQLGESAATITLPLPLVALVDNSVPVQCFAGKTKMNDAGKGQFYYAQKLIVMIFFVDFSNSLGL